MDNEYTNSVVEAFLGKPDHDGISKFMKSPLAQAEAVIFVRTRSPGHLSLKCGHCLAFSTRAFLGFSPGGLAYLFFIGGSA